MGDRAPPWKEHGAEPPAGHAGRAPTSARCVGPRARMAEPTTRTASAGRLPHTAARGTRLLRSCVRSRRWPHPGQGRARLIACEPFEGELVTPTILIPPMRSSSHGPRYGPSCSSPSLYPCGPPTKPLIAKSVRQTAPRAVRIARAPYSARRHFESGSKIAISKQKLSDLFACEWLRAPATMQTNLLVLVVRQVNRPGFPGGSVT